MIQVRTAFPQPTYEERREALRAAIAAGIQLNRLLYVRSIVDKLQVEEWKDQS